MIVFAGPSIDAACRDAHAQLDWRPPASAGDLLALVGSGAGKVLLIDGLFDERASVKHKEAMALMASGTRLYGAASMGALRAAELADEGMIPLGAIATAYRRGLLVGDDEVALVHGDARIGWQAVSVAMVDVRATLCRAVRTGLLDGTEARALRTAWHALHFVDRDWPAMIAAQDVVSPDRAQEVAALHVPLKRLDAEQALAMALADTTRRVAPEPPPETLFLERLRRA